MKNLKFKFKWNLNWFWVKFELNSYWIQVIGFEISLLVFIVFEHGFHRNQFEVLFWIDLEVTKFWWRLLVWELLFEYIRRRTNLDAFCEGRWNEAILMLSFNLQLWLEITITMFFYLPRRWDKSLWWIDDDFDIYDEFLLVDEMRQVSMSLKIRPSMR